MRSMPIIKSLSMQYSVTRKKFPFDIILNDRIYQHEEFSEIEYEKNVYLIIIY